MGHPVAIHKEDERRICRLKLRLGIRTKVDVMRAGLDLLERQAERREQILRWKRAAALVAPTSRGVGAEFQVRSRLKRL